MTSLCQQTAINVFNIYSTRMVTLLNEGITEDALSIPANVCTQLFGVFQLISSIISSFVVRRFRRRQLMIWGQVFISIALFGLAASLEAKSSLMTLLLILFHASVFSVTIGVVHWIYIPEFLNDVQFGFVCTFHYLNGVEISIVTEYLFNGLGLGGTFIFYGLISFAGIFFFIWNLKETDGLTDRQKKQLYWPRKAKQRKVET
mmetsp:Transcript_18127/g.30966  ORF Transcript_18127/g.30966 Transcript_18127/m.30966 type:complete len:203 (+) Transcript_18127:1058-1666(+)